MFSVAPTIFFILDYQYVDILFSTLYCIIQFNNYIFALEIRLKTN
jgi:hypothetical protein